MTKKELGRKEVYASVETLAEPEIIFANDLSAIAEEMLMNASRAGARRMSVTIEAALGTVTVSHDGKSPSYKDAATILDFRISEQSAQASTPGLYSLALSGATMSARDWRLTVPEGVLQGRPATLERYAAPRRMTTVTFRCPGAEDPRRRQDIAAVFRKAAAAMPFSTIVDDSPVARYRPADQIHAPDGGRFCVEVERQIGDWLIVVARFENERDRWRNPSPHEVVGRHWLVLATDVGGIVTRPDAAEIARLHPALASPVEDRLLRRSGDRHVGVEPGYIAVIQAAARVSRVPRQSALPAILGADQGAIAEALVEMIAGLATLAPRNAVPADHPIRVIAEDRAHPVPPRQAVATRPRRRHRNTSSGYAAERLTPQADERGALIVFDNGFITHKEASLIDGLTVLPAFGAMFSELLAAAAETQPSILEALVETSAPISGLDEVVGFSLVVDGRQRVIAKHASLDDAAVAAGWLSSGLSQGIAGARSLMLVIERRRGIPLKASIRHACVDLGTEQPGVIVRIPNVEAITSSLVRIIPWRMTDTDDPARDLARFRDRTIRQLNHALRQLRQGREVAAGD